MVLYKVMFFKAVRHSNISYTSINDHFSPLTLSVVGVPSIFFFFFFFYQFDLLEIVLLVLFRDVAYQGPYWQYQSLLI